MKVVTWSVVILGILFGIVFLSALGARQVDSPDSGWLLLACLAVGLAYTVASCIAVWNRSLAALVFLLTTLLMLPLNLNSSFRVIVNGAAAWIFGSLLFFGLFWSLTARAGWPPLKAQSVPIRRKVLIGILAFFSLTCLVVVGAVVITMLPLKLVVDCSWPNSFTADRYKGAVFVATLRDPGIGVVKERFRGVGVRTRYVLIAHWGIGHNALSGMTYFIEGRQSDGWITRFLPVVDTTYCGRRDPINEAALDLRILRAGFSPNTVRIVGQVRWNGNQPRFGTKIMCIGPKGNIAASTDSDGIFELKDLPAGHYELRAEQCDEWKSRPYNRCSVQADLVAGNTWGVELWFGQ